MTGDRKAIGLAEAVSIGIGGMVGGGIFAVLGLAVKLSGGGTPVAFMIAGLVAIVTSYSYAKLSVAYPSPGGTVKFIIKGYGNGLFSGTMNLLIWISYIIMLSLYAYAFGSYGATFFPENIQFLMKHVLATAVILILMFLNVLKANVVGKAEDVIVAIKLAILIVFTAIGLLSVNTASLSPSTWSPALTLVSGGFIIFVAYEGFELIANTAKDVRNPEKTLPHAFYISVGFVAVLYILIAIVAVGNLSLDKIAASSDYALAEAATPFLGHAGFVLIAIAALLSTASAINATFYGTARLSYIIAKSGELPHFLEKEVWNRHLEGLFITAAITLVITNTLDLQDISTMGSAGFLIIFAAVNYANVRLSKETGSKRIIPALGTVLCLAAAGFLVYDTVVTAPVKLLVLVVMFGLAFGIEYLYYHLGEREISIDDREEDDF
ncbi:amino acid transporter [Methanomicrobium sp. W14]|uniref:APC family permease n=1 Tax=Methanomicrobium sp. W14 TaxID=2817839 RepID=UPI001AEA331B|nr:APC family permease [Methanomicrobium sp. W14]MBP2134193.1 amino acid transporter [Methanomicrobium sp. W14]